MIRSFFSSIFAYPAVIIASLAITLLAVRYIAFQPSLYKDALVQANAYNTITELSTEQYLDFKDSQFKDGDEEKENEFGPILAEQVLDTLFSNINLNNTIKVTAENNINNISRWANGEEETIYLYFPRNEIIESYAQEKNPRKVFINQFFEASGINALPECPSFEIYSSIDDVDLENLKCTSPEVESLIRKELDKQLPKDKNFNFVEETLNEIAPDLKERTDVLELQQDEGAKEDLKTNLNQIQEYIEQSYYAIGLVFGASVVLALIAGIIAKRHSLVFFRVFMFAGALTSLVSIVMRYAIVSVTNILLTSEIQVSDAVLTPEQVETVERMLKLIAQGVLIKVLETTALFGIIAIIISLIFLFISKHTGAYTKPDDEEEDEITEDLSDKFEHEVHPKYRKVRPKPQSLNSEATQPVTNSNEDQNEATITHPNNESFEHNILEQERETLDSKPKTNEGDSTERVQTQ